MISNKLAVLTTLGLLLSACSSTPPKVEWVVDRGFDPFTDEQTCKVTTASLYTKSATYTYSNHLYPFIEKINGEIAVGLRSGGKFKVPVGNIQLRIDKNDAWEIFTSETPVVDTNEVSQPNVMSGYIDNLPKKQKELVVNSYNAAMTSTGKMLSPYTATTGEKAKTIIKEMLQGDVLIYRTTGLSNVPNYTESSTGTFLLDASLKSAMDKCNLTIK
mgnify:CR=1 FL=1